MKIHLIDEYNESGHLVWVENFAGAFVRGKTLEDSLKKLPTELQQYSKWAQIYCDLEHIQTEIIQSKKSALQICDADTDVLFDSEKGALSPEEYARLKTLALKSAMDFMNMYNTVPDKDGTNLAQRSTFYGKIPTTATEMYLHTKNVNAYYFGEIGVDADNEEDILTCRLRAFELLEQQKDFLINEIWGDEASEEWTLKKVLRRFIWHDRIHAKAMYRMATKLCGNCIANPFYFELT